MNGLKQDSCNFDLLYALFTFHMNKNKCATAALYIEINAKYYPSPITEKL